ncbi:hypothetical protein HMPREF3232_00384 [Fannyhessea vaginae]|nr:hypothetical protein HMPREF3232_00384 [Fannyhessea vaginae]
MLSTFCYEVPNYWNISTEAHQQAYQLRVCVHIMPMFTGVQ